MIRPAVHLFIALGIFAGACIGYGIAYHALGTLSASVTALTKEVAAKKESAAAATLAADELARLSVEEEQINGYFVVQDNIVSFLETLQAKGVVLGSVIKVVSVSANPGTRPHLDLALSITGSFDAVMRTVGSIEYSPHDITVTSLVLDVIDSADEDAPPGWTATMKMTVGTATSTKP